MKHMEEAFPWEYQHPCAQLLQLLALCPSDNVPWSLFDGGANGEGSIMHRGARVELHGFVKATANNGRRGRVMEVYKDGSIGVIFGCDQNVLTPAKPGAEVLRFKEGNVRLLGPKGAHEDVLDAYAPTQTGFLPPSDMCRELHDPQELKKVAAYLKAVMPAVVQVDEVRRTFGMHEIVAGHIQRALGCQTDRMRALLHARCGLYLDEEHADPRLHKVMREITCVAAELAVTCRRAGRMEGGGWGAGMLLKIFGMSRYAWGEESLVTTRCLKLAHYVLVGDICHQLVVSQGVCTSEGILGLCDAPSVREVMDVSVGPFNFMRCMLSYLGADGSSSAARPNPNPNPYMLKGVSWRFRSLRGTVDTDEKVLKQIRDALAEADAAWHWELSVTLMNAMSAAAQRLGGRGLTERSVCMYEQALKMSSELLGGEHLQTQYMKYQLQGQQKRLVAGGGGSMDSSSKSSPAAS